MTEARIVAEQRDDSRSIPWLVVPEWRERFGVIAGITGRGDPESPFDLGLASGEPTRAVMDRWRALRAAFPEATGIVVARQVHGRKVLWHESRDGWTILEGADGHATRAEGLLLAVSVADCIPIYLLDPTRRAVALLHSGWRGTAAGILAAGIDALVSRAGSRVGDLLLHAGVGICASCYEVSADVASACGRPAPDGAKVQLDLRAVIVEQARAAGIGSVSVSPRCSAHESEFMSHRGSGGKDGRMVALLGVPTPPGEGAPSR